ncbi:proliferation-associated protein 2G4 [Lepeophtheirus salmonis]|uniref:Proliferation-associated protein 2G4 n=1 Tax=Lepeophtheirus salmonis TaxID=72036 RepID=C1BTA9_LEPSM|nr:proliferation-associated protein 2G4-like [Lepeophtheirus salmonis]ACO12262.1 Proliferation-associated protein 2G4 [Lepeophtheirus salmonis]ADD38881.1 Proliferation-associated protein 2G4 [Lepeophtheirus salmonis]
MGDHHRQDNEDELPSISDDLVVTKYKMASDIVNRVLKETVAKCIVGASVKELCKWADGKLEEETGKAFKKDRKLLKGIAFPCCISRNNCICHLSPLASDPDVLLEDGDMVKIDMGAHIDGFIAVVAHTLVVQADPNKKIDGRKADALLAAHYASVAALRLVRPGKNTYTITDCVQKIAESYSCKPVEDMLSHQLEQNTINGEKTIIQNPSEAQRKEHEKYEFGLHEVYAIDVLVSTGEGQGRARDAKVTVFKKTDETYMLKMKHSREFFTAISKKHGSMPFTLRSMENETKAKMGVVECISHNLIEPFQVLYEKDNENVAQFKFTVLLMPNGPDKITGLPFDPETCISDKKIDDPEIQKLLASSIKNKPAKKKKKKPTTDKTNAGETASEAPQLVAS